MGAYIVLRVVVLESFFFGHYAQRFLPQDVRSRGFRLVGAWPWRSYFGSEHFWFLLNQCADVVVHARYYPRVLLTAGSLHAHTV